MIDTSTTSPAGLSSIAARWVTEGRFAEAADLLERAIASYPGNAQLRFHLGACYATANQLHLAHDEFRRAVGLDPLLAGAHAGLGALYLVQGLVDLAMESSSVAMRLSPGNSKIVLSHARILEAAGQIDSAWTLVEQLMSGGKITAPVVRLFGRMARHRNRQSDALVAVMRLLKENRSSKNERAALHFTAADLLDSLGEYDRAFAHARMGNEIARPVYDAGAHAGTIGRFIEYFTAERMKGLARAGVGSGVGSGVGAGVGLGENSRVPVFIVGMPRSGTSLVEQILASHPQIFGAGELDFMEQVFHGTVKMVGGRVFDYPQCLDRLTVDQADGMGQIYLQPLIWMSPGSARITDKLPLNFLHLGLINLLLPGSRIIHCRRDPRDTCLSCYMNLFTSGNDFKFDLTHLGLFYRQYQRLMEHWGHVLDVSMLEVQYEKVVGGMQQEIDRMLKFLDLPYDAACADFHLMDRPVLSSSIEQVRQPLYQSSVGRWRNYEKHLTPLFEALEG